MASLFKPTASGHDVTDAIAELARLSPAFRDAARELGFHDLGTFLGAIVRSGLAGGRPGRKERLTIEHGVVEWSLSGPELWGELHGTPRRIYGEYEPGFTLRVPNERLRAEGGGLYFTPQKRLSADDRRNARAMGWEVIGR